MWTPFFLLALSLLGLEAAPAVVPGRDCPAAVPAAVQSLLAPFGGSPYRIALGFGADSHCDAAALGEGFTAHGQAAEGFTIRLLSDNTTVCVSGGGVGFGAFALLEALGFGFFHPLAPTTPVRLRALPPGYSHSFIGPRFQFRAFHIHTEHPIEMIDLLQGQDATIPSNSSGSTTGTTVSASPLSPSPVVIKWEDMHHEWVKWLMWALANRVNRVQWVLLQWPKAIRSRFVNSTLRRTRLRNLTDTARSFGVMTGADVPIAEVQQNAWVMVLNPSLQHFDDAKRQISARLDWLLDPTTGAKFDYLVTESGFSEFTHPNGTLMLRLMDEVADQAKARFDVDTLIKVHCSSGQTAPGYPDPRPGRDPSIPINFNYLPHYASKNLGILPHTIQAYSLDDPTAGAYGNANFSDMFDFMLYEAERDDLNRTVVFHPETNYWVNVDVDVPLFLPLYGQRRVRDLRLIDAEEKRRGVRAQSNDTVQGQLIFDSGWEWASWLSDVIAARSMWDNDMYDKADSDDAALQIALGPLRATLADAQCSSCIDVIVEIAAAQQGLLIDGVYDGNKNSPPTEEELASGLSGFAYLSGMDSWTTLLAVVKPKALTQPRRIWFRDHAHPLYPKVEGLLAAMDETFARLADKLARLGGNVTASASAKDLIDDMVDSMRMVALRAKHMHLLYQATAPGVGAQDRKTLLAQARVVIGNATRVVCGRESDYRVQPHGRVSAWRPNPTAYNYGYLWTVSSLYYFWRDYGIAERGGVDSLVEPCYLNMIDTSQTILGLGRNISREIRRVRSGLGVVGKMVGTCLAPPEVGYEFPRDLYRY